MVRGLSECVKKVAMWSAIKKNVGQRDEEDNIDAKHWNDYSSSNDKHTHTHTLVCRCVCVSIFREEITQKKGKDKKAKVTLQKAKQK